jgi:hypothetical protein
MSSDAAGQEPEGRKEPMGEPDQWSSLTRLLKIYPVGLWQARDLLDACGGGEAGVLAARRHLDSELRALADWPSGRDYARAAADYEADGLHKEATLLRKIAAADELIVASKRRWNERFDARGPSQVAEVIEGLQGSGFIDLDPDGPYYGTDGAAYQPGVLRYGLSEKPVLIVSARALSDLLLDWAGWDDMYRWIADRGTTGAGELTPPPVPAVSRGWQEETVLARLVSSPQDESALTAKVRPDTFTTDVRYELYAAVRVLAGRGKRFTSETIGAELARQMDRVPGYALANYGGPGAPWAYAYLRRLSATLVTPEAAFDAAVALSQEDGHERSRASAARSRLGLAQRGHMSETARRQAPGPAPAARLRRPGPPHDPGRAPAPGM